MINIVTCQHNSSALFLHSISNIYLYQSRIHYLCSCVHTMTVHFTFSKSNGGGGGGGGDVCLCVCVCVCV